MNQSEFLAITSNLLKARKKSRVQDTIGFPWLLIRLKTECYNRNRVITFDRTFLQSFEMLAEAPLCLCNHRRLRVYGPQCLSQ